MSLRSRLLFSKSLEVVTARSSLEFIGNVLPVLKTFLNYLLLSEYGSKRLCLKMLICFGEISHQRVGGVNIQASLLLRLKDWELEAKVGQEIGRIINYKTRRPQVAANEDLTFKHYKVGDWLR
jgi:hypothetical protein